MQNGDDFDIDVQRYNGAAWLLYQGYNITMAGGVISINTGAGAVAQSAGEINLESMYLDSTRTLRIRRTRNSGTDRNFQIYHNVME